MAAAIEIDPSEVGAIDECVKRFALCAPLPEGWSAEIDDESGRVFYQNNETGETQWEKPSVPDPSFFTDFRPPVQRQAPLQLPPNWVARLDPMTGRTYYANTVTKTTQWEFPQAIISSDRFEEELNPIYRPVTVFEQKHI